MPKKPCKLCKKTVYKVGATYCQFHKIQKAKEASRKAQVKFRASTATEPVFRISGIELFNLRRSISELLILNKKFNEKMVKIGVEDSEVTQGMLETLVLSETIITILSEALPTNFFLEKAPWLAIHTEYLNMWIDVLPTRLEIARLVRSKNILRQSPSLPPNGNRSK